MLYDPYQGKNMCRKDHIICGNFFFYKRALTVRRNINLGNLAAEKLAISAIRKRALLEQQTECFRL